MGDVSGGWWGTPRNRQGRAALWISEMYNQEQKTGEGKLFVGKKMMSIKVTVWSTQEMS